jgi:hypothetical protein
LLVLRFLHGELDGRGFVLRFGPLLAFQLCVSTELLLTFTLALAGACVLAGSCVPSVRTELRRLIVPLTASYGVAAVLTVPLVVYLVTGFESRSINPPSGYPADLANLVVPTELSWLTNHWTSAQAERFLGNRGENGAYLGLPLLAIAGSTLWARRRTAAGRFLASCLAVGILAELGNGLHVFGHRYAPLPWALPAHLPAFDNVLPVRLSVFVALVVAVIAALWASARSVPLAVRVCLVLAAVGFTLPDPYLRYWRAAPTNPAFFADGIYRDCLRLHETVLVLPYGPLSDAMLWQAETGFGWRLADGYLRPAPPHSLPYWQTAVELDDQVILPGTPATFRRLARRQHVTTIVQFPRRLRLWSPLVAGLHDREAVGGIYLYRLSGTLAGCRSRSGHRGASSTSSTPTSARAASSASRRASSCSAAASTRSSCSTASRTRRAT